MARTGRPKIEIDKKIFENLCGIQCTEKEICSCFGCCEDTLNSWCKRTYKKTFSDIYKEKAVLGRISLRRSQFRLAEKNANMAIWLGKQYLSQRDEPEEIAEDVEDNFMDALNQSAKEVWGEDLEDAEQQD